MPSPSRSLQCRFIHHLVTGLRGSLAKAGNSLADELMPLDAILSSPEPDLYAAKIAADQISREWDRRQHSGPSAEDEVPAMVTQALGMLADAIDHVLAGTGDLDGFVSTVLQCRDRVMAIDLMSMWKRESNRGSSALPMKRCSSAISQP